VHTASLILFAFENRSYLEFEAEFKKALALELGAQGVLFDEKTEGRKSRDTVPLIILILAIFMYQQYLRAKSLFNFFYCLINLILALFMYQQ
jgi:hypothetical protein